ncbi:calcineurin-binding protein cabin-1 isoform X2 [Aedes aegypti]|uniref:Uncharacterized protein n=1 Tax=Aedes aegypti TaxID=7159 RepID=A0A6I8TZE0_AEDAE|nr:calcineurin-binding protein cabin-1 isoform X2 [Aedes aegypti]
MLPIRALNDDFEEDNSCSNDTELKFSGEAEETIIVAEYMKALNYVHTGQHCSALRLFLELLETEALSKQLDNNQESRLLLVKYNCYRNIGMLYQEKGNNSLALDYLTHAIELDDNDVYTMCSLAELAIKNGQIPVAKIYFEKCLERNPNHWPSVDGMLQLLLTSENIIEAWLWAIHCHKMDKNYRKAIDVLQEINTRFTSSRQFMENLLKEKLPTPYAVDGVITKYSNFTKSNCAALVDGTDNRIQADIDFEKIRISQINWTTIGTLILQLHQLLKQTDQIIKHFHLSDCFGKPIEKQMWDCNVVDAPSCHIISDDTAPEITDARSSTNLDSAMDNEAKSRRRGSELKILEQWGWHKNRRSTKRKSLHDSAEFIESTADGFLKRALSQYFMKSFTDEKSPFTEQPYEQSSAESSQNMVSASNTAELFFQTAKDDFNSMITEMNEREIDLYLLINLYLQHMSLYWNIEMPSELRSLYIQVYDVFAEFVSHDTWNQLQIEELTVIYRMTLFYVELCHDSIEEKSLDSKSYKSSFEKELRILQLYASSILSNYLITYQSRNLWLNYVVAMYENKLDLALNMLVQITSLVDDQPDFEVHLPNQQFNNFYNKTKIQKMIVSIKRQIDLNSVKDLYYTSSYDKIVNILEDSLIHSSDIQFGKGDLLSISTQIEILLESFWHLERYLDCLVWAEKSLKYAVDLFVSIQNGSFLRRNDYARLINYVLPYIQVLIEKSVDCTALFKNMARLIQSIHKLLTHLLDNQQEKQMFNHCTIECWRAWVIIYYVLQRRQWCSIGNNRFLFMMLDTIVPILRSPMFEPYRDMINDCLEQTTYCLYGYPPKKGRTRHLQDHESTSADLTWEKAVQLFEIYRPDILPEFNSYKIDSISADMEALLQHILLLMPDIYAVSPYTGPVIDFINGNANTFINHERDNLLCLQIRSIYYILADYYFKSRDFSKAIKYYTMDLTLEPTRFDSWAGISLSKASKCETMLNSAEELSYRPFLDETYSTIRCFKQSLKLNQHDPQVWVEYGSFAYNVSAFCSRYIKHDSFSVDSASYLKCQQTYHLGIAYECFNKVNTEYSLDQKEDRNFEANEDEKWLYHYMLGKIAEKNKERPVVYLTHYLKAAKYLYECSATYPIKINHSNPSQLSIEALEVFYRTNAAIMKYTEKHSLICKQEAGLFKKILKELTVSPFAVNRAKISDVALKKKLAEPVDVLLIDNRLPIAHKSDLTSNITTDNISSSTLDEKTFENKETKYNNDKLDYLSRRASQESNPITNTSTISNATSSMSSVSDSQSSGSESDSTTDDELSITPADRDSIFKDCIRNLEECVIRFPEHYKSIYRLAYHYLNAPGETKSLERCNQLLLGSYKAALGNHVAGLFTERRSNNFFNGIWRIPSSDIDRPGSFSTHLAKCVAILIETLKRNDDHETLLELAIQLYRRPDSDKEYLNDYDRNKLSLQAIQTCVIVYQHILKKSVARKDDTATLTLLVAIYKGYRKCVKTMQHKESFISDALIEAYKVYIQDKAKLPDSANLLDLAVKLCTYEINYRKSMDKIVGKQMEKTSKIINICADTPSTIITPMQPISASFIPGLTKHRKMVVPKLLSTSSVSPPAKFVSVGSSSISTSSLAGLTITPVNIPLLTSAGNGAVTKASNTNVSSSLSAGTSELLKTFSDPETISELSRMYFSALSNLNQDYTKTNK